MAAIFGVATLLIGIAVILAGNGLIGTLLGIRGEMASFSSATMGLIMGGYFIGFVAGTFVIPQRVRQVGHIRMFAALASMASIITLLHGLFVVPALWFVLRILAGFCVVGLYIVIESWLNEQTDNADRGNIFSAYMTTTLIGLGAGQALLLVGDINTLQLFALASVLLSLGLIPVAMTRVKEPLITEAQRLGLKKLYAISPLGVVACVFSGLGAGAFWGLGPVFAANMGLSTQAIAGFMGLTIFGGVVMMWPVGKLSDRYERRKVLLAACGLTAIMALIAHLLMGYDKDTLLLGGFLYGSFAFSIYSLAAAHTNDHVEPEQMLEVSSSLQLLWGGGAIVGPILTGFLMQSISPSVFLPFLMGAALIPAVFAIWRIQVSDAIDPEDQGDFVPQFATSPVALEMHPDQEEELESTDSDLPGKPSGT
ncbi:MAG TPA: MFS transporter [Wenzhouxiangella sp.]